MYRIADGHKLFDKDCYHVTFSPDVQYAAINGDGLYRLSNQEKLFDIVGIVRSFSSDGSYLNVGFQEEDTSVYRVRDQGLYLLDVPAGIMAIGNTALVVDFAQRGQRLLVVYIDADQIELYDGPSGEYGFSWIRGKRYLVVLATENGWHQVDFQGETGWLPPDAGANFHTPD